MQAGNPQGRQALPQQASDVTVANNADASAIKQPLQHVRLCGDSGQHVLDHRIGIGTGRCGKPDTRCSKPVDVHMVQPCRRAPHKTHPAALKQGGIHARHRAHQQHIDIPQVASRNVPSFHHTHLAEVVEVCVQAGNILVGENAHQSGWAAVALIRAGVSGPLLPNSNCRAR